MTSLDDKDRELLVRLDERTAHISDHVSGMRADLKENYVHKRDFLPIKAIVYGGVGLMLLTVFGLMVSTGIGT